MLVVHQLVDGDAFADDDVGFELDAHAAQVVDFAFDDGLGQAELGNAVDEHAAEFVQGLKDADAMAFLHEIAGGAESPAGPLPTMATLLPVEGAIGGQAELAAGALEVGDKALEVADGDGRAFFAQHASAFALVLLRADAAGDGGQGVVFAHFGGGGKIVARADEGDDIFDFYAYRAIDDAAGLGAGDAARGFSEGVGGVRPRFTSSKLRQRICRSELGHVPAHDLHALFERKHIHGRTRKRVSLRHGALSASSLRNSAASSTWRLARREAGPALLPCAPRTA